MSAEIIKLHQKINTIFVYVTHDQTEAMTPGDCIGIMKDGFEGKVDVSELMGSTVHYTFSSHVCHVFK